MVQGMGGVVAPLLAGFSLATIAVLLTTGSVNASKPTGDGPPHADLAVAALALAAALFLLTMEFAFWAARYATSPQERMDWTAEAVVNRPALDQARTEQAMDRQLADYYSGRARWMYNGGLLLFFAGLGALLIPQRWSPPFVVAAGVVFLTLAFEIWAVFLQCPRGLYSAIFPSYDDVRAKVTEKIDPLDDTLRGSIMRER